MLYTKISFLKRAPILEPSSKKGVIHSAEMSELANIVLGKVVTLKKTRIFTDSAEAVFVVYLLPHTKKSRARLITVKATIGRRPLTSLMESTAIPTTDSSQSKGTAVTDHKCNTGDTHSSTKQRATRGSLKRLTY